MQLQNRKLGWHVRALTAEALSCCFVFWIKINICCINIENCFVFLKYSDTKRKSTRLLSYNKNNGINFNRVTDVTCGSEIRFNESRIRRLEIGCSCWHFVLFKSAKSTVCILLGTLNTNTAKITEKGN